jgi:hypothetical protein
MNPPEIEPTTFPTLARCLNQLRHSVHASNTYYNKQTKYCTCSVSLVLVNHKQGDSSVLYLVAALNGHLPLQYTRAN